MEKLVLFKSWAKIKCQAYTLVESLVAMIIITLIFSFLITSIVGISTKSSSLDKCKEIIEIEQFGNQESEQNINQEKEMFLGVEKNIYYSTKHDFKWEIWRVKR